MEHADGQTRPSHYAFTLCAGRMTTARRMKVTFTYFFRYCAMKREKPRRSESGSAGRFTEAVTPSVSTLHRGRVSAAVARSSSTMASSSSPPISFLIFGIFHGVVSSSDYIVSNGKMISE
jgi:hypothetical protein